MAAVDGSVDALGYDRASLPPPSVVHVGVGNFARAHFGAYHHALLRAQVAAATATAAAGAASGGEGGGGEAPDDRRWGGILGLGLLPSDAGMVADLASQGHLYSLITRSLPPTGGGGGGGGGDDGDGGDGGSGGDVDGGDCGGTYTYTPIGSFVGMLHAPADPAAAVGALAHSAVRLVTLTVTEKGYHTLPGGGGLDWAHPDVAADVAHPARPVTAAGYILAAVRARRAAGSAPFVVLSCDNVPANGAVLRAAVVALARRHEEDATAAGSLGTGAGGKASVAAATPPWGVVEAGLADWLADGGVRFLCSMVDRITPVTTAADIAFVRRRWGVADARPVLCEPYTQFVVEAPGGTDGDANADALLPPWPRESGVAVVPRRVVEAYELLKIRLLNVPHSALSYPGMLLGMTYVHEAARHPPLAAYLSRLMNAVIPRSLATPLAILSEHTPAFRLSEYTASLASRFADAGVGDALARVAQDGSSKYPAQLLPIVRSLPAAAAAGASPPPPPPPPSADVQALAFAVATWAAALGHPSLPVADGRREELRSALHVGAPDAADAGIWRLLGAAGLFGADGRRGAVLADAAAAQYMAIQRDGVAAALAAVLAAE